MVNRGEKGVSMPQTHWEEFWLWVEQEKDKRGLGWNTFEELAGLTSGALWRLHNKSKPLTRFEQAEAIARGLDIPLDDVMIKAGYLDPDAGIDASIRGFGEVLKRLTLAERERSC